MVEVTVSPDEVRRFDALAAHWWDPDGPMRPLHRMNPARIEWIVERLGDARRVLDVGCGAGIAAEALARLGLDVLGIDAAAETIAAAQRHAAGLEGAPTYRVATVEELLAEGRRFPAITALEVIEHVPDPARFLNVLTALLEPGGLLFLSTLNRTQRSFLAAKVGAEYLLRWLPVGTHDWRRFIKPAELAAMLRDAGLRVTDMAGLAPDPLRGGWRVVRDTAVNYLVAAER